MACVCLSICFAIHYCLRKEGEEGGGVRPLIVIVDSDSDSQANLLITYMSHMDERC